MHVCHKERETQSIQSQTGLGPTSRKLLVHSGHFTAFTGVAHQAVHLPIWAPPTSQPRPQCHRIPSGYTSHRSPPRRTHTLPWSHTYRARRRFGVRVRHQVRSKWCSDLSFVISISFKML